MTRNPRTLPLVLALGALLFAASAGAQAPSAQLPPGHPPIGGPPAAAPPLAQPGLPAGHPPITGPITPASPLPDEEQDDQALPPGHPPLDAQQAPPRGPMSMGAPVSDDPSIPAGSVVFKVRNGRQQPVGGLEVVLHIIRKTIAEGETRSEKIAKVDAEGSVRFDSLKFGSEWVYQATAKYTSIDYRSPEFQLSPAAGKRVALVVFETTNDMDAAHVGVQTFLALEPREEFLQVEQILHFANLGDRTWTVPDVVVPLERGYQAFQGSEEGGEVRVEQVEGRGYRVAGYVRPGSQEVSFRYQVPYETGEVLRFTAFLPPRVAQVRVISAATGSTRMRVEAMPEPVTTKGNDGQRLFVTERLVLPGGDQIDQVVIAVQGLPVPGNARWYAVGLAFVAVLVGFWLALSGTSKAGREQEPGLQGELERARKELLERIAELEQAHGRGDIGPKTYEHSRRGLLDTLARLIAMEKAASSAKARA
jgi:hypothetical protein